MSDALAKQTQILNDVRAFSEEKELTTILISESGSRAWGYESAISDYDVKVLCAHNTDLYKDYYSPKETFTHQADALHDYTYWDIRKLISMLAKGNAQVYELFNSPQLYYTSRLSDGLTDIVNVMLTERIREVAYHYYGLAHKTFKQRIAGTGEPTSKKYLYVLRPLMHVEQIVATEKLPDLRFQTCMLKTKDMFPKKVWNETANLLDMKRNNLVDASTCKGRFDDLDRFCEDKINYWQTELKSFAVRDKLVHSTRNNINDLYRFLAFAQPLTEELKDVIAHKT